MKKIYLCIIVSLLIVGHFSCKKDSIEQQPNNDSEMIIRSKKVVALIKAFDKKMEGALKSGETISLDSAVWNMEASLNFNYADPQEAEGEYSITTHTYTLAVDESGEVLMSDVQTLYDQMEDDLGNNQKSSGDETLVFSDVAVDSIIGGTA